MKKITFLLLVILLTNTLYAQRLKPGFDRDEYIDMMKISAQFGAPEYAAALKPPPQYKYVYRSPNVGIGNSWDLYVNNNGLAVISIRGTTADRTSWLANFYAAMVPAKGTLRLSATDNFDYQLADNPRATVHIGWLVSTAFLSKTMLPMIDSLYKKGTKDIIIMGHSQGGAIAYLLTAYIYHLQRSNKVPADIRFKTYCSAAPKPGNLYFAYDYEAMTQQGWSYNVVNAADWVPETPFSIQTLDDFNNINPFKHAPVFIRKIKWPARWALKHAFNRMDKPSRKAMRNYRKYLGSFLAKQVKQTVNGYIPPAYAYTMNYVRTGAFIVLQPDSGYYQKYPQEDTAIFRNHFHPPYLYLAEKLPGVNQPANMNNNSSLDGTWNLTSFNGQAVANLFPDRQPFINFNLADKKVNGNTSCNSFNGTINIEGSNMKFPEAMAMTRMSCPGQGEQIFLEALKKVTSWSISGAELELKAANSWCKRKRVEYIH